MGQISSTYQAPASVIKSIQRGRMTIPNLSRGGNQDVTITEVAVGKSVLSILTLIPGDYDGRGYLLLASSTVLRFEYSGSYRGGEVEYQVVEYY